MEMRNTDVRYLILDTETTTKNEGNPFTKENRLCLVSYATATESGYFVIEHGEEPYGDAITKIQSLVNGSDLLVGFNFKFDLHWLRRYGIVVSDRHRVWDCQLVEFLLDKQRTPFPSLDWCLARRNLGAKDSDGVNSYWDSGVDTPDIPIAVLSQYGLKDAELTKELFLKQYEEVQCSDRPFRSLVSLSNADLLVTAEMEWNGMLLDVDSCGVENRKAEAAIGELTKQICSFFGADWINLDSPKQLSAVLYGGQVVRETREAVGVYKSGQKIGQTRYAVRRETHDFPRLVEPVNGTGLVGGGYSTSEDSLRSLRPRSKRVADTLELLLRRSKLEKLRGTYLDGLPKLISTMGWAGNYLHGQINHCVARTGRTSSSKPNMQNLPPEVDVLFRSRFGESGTVIAFDAKGLEWVAVVFETQDPVGMQEIIEGVDQHERNKERFGLPEKRVAKYFVFRIIFGGTAFTFTRDPDFAWISRSEEWWQKVVDEFYSKYRGIKVGHSNWIREAIETGGYTTSTGRKFEFTPIGGRGGPWPETTIKNYRVQSLGHDLMAIARVSLKRRLDPLNLKSKLCNTIHDSIVLDIFNEEWYTIHTLVNDVFKDIPKNFEKLFGVSFNLPMRVEAKRLDGAEINA